MMDLSTYEGPYGVFYLLRYSRYLRHFFIVSYVSKVKDFTLLAIKQQIFTLSLELDWLKNFYIIFTPFNIFCLFSNIFWIIFFSISEIAEDFVFFKVKFPVFNPLLLELV